MFERNYDYIQARHQSLLSVAEEERLTRNLRNTRPAIKDLILLRLGNIFITLGRKIKYASSICEEVSRNEFAGECS